MKFQSCMQNELEQNVQYIKYLLLLIELDFISKWRMHGITCTPSVMCI